MNGMVFHHIGIACRDMEREKVHYQILGYQQEGPDFSDPLQKIHGCFMTGIGPRIELLAPMDEASPVTVWLEKGVKMYHQAFEAPDFDGGIQNLKSKGARIM